MSSCVLKVSTFPTLHFLVKDGQVAAEYEGALIGHNSLFTGVRLPGLHSAVDQRMSLEVVLVAAARRWRWRSFQDLLSESVPADDGSACGWVRGRLSWRRSVTDESTKVERERADVFRRADWTFGSWTDHQRRRIAAEDLQIFQVVHHPAATPIGGGWAPASHPPPSSVAPCGGLESQTYVGVETADNWIQHAASIATGRVAPLWWPFRSTAQPPLGGRSVEHRKPDVRDVEPIDTAGFRRIRVSSGACRRRTRRPDSPVSIAGRSLQTDRCAICPKRNGRRRGKWPRRWKKKAVTWSPVVQWRLQWAPMAFLWRKN